MCFKGENEGIDNKNVMLISNLNWVICIGKEFFFEMGKNNSNWNLIKYNTLYNTFYHKNYFDILVGASPKIFFLMQSFAKRTKTVKGTWVLKKPCVGV